MGKFGHVLAEKKVTLQWLINSNMVKPEKFGHLPLVYHFTFPLGVKPHSKPWFDSEIFSAIQKKTSYTQDKKNEA